MKNSNGKNGSKEIYVVKDREGNVRFKGTAKEIEERFGIDARNVQAYYNITHLFADAYRIDRDRPCDETYAYLVKHIKEYGNTCLSGMNEKRVKKYLALLKEREGIECTFKRIKYKEDLSAWYLIERRKNDV